ncbi:MAG: RtcB family protein, partial [Chloroflexota bacterium]|nr:RtcB family protein [Chloroflexota bacterium]
GSMGTASYVVRGLGSEAAFETAPHGAGRRFSRGEARRRFTMDDFDRDMQGIEVRRSKEFIDELPGAYKDIDTVMEQSKDLVEIVHTFRQIVNVKGD